MDDTKILVEISQLKNKLDTYNRIGNNFLPRELKELRNYIFQVHVAYEASMHALIALHYFQQSVLPDKADAILSNLTFPEKIKITVGLKPAFPSVSALKLNSLRNEFAHKPGEQLRSMYGGIISQRRKLKSLSKYQDNIDAFWLEDSGMSKEEAVSHVELNNGRFN